ncbi:MAG TPA: hypothetical protein VFZ09_24885 [Archangium sp.]|uniref:hypothetical protein n=1 Tax=Archangium sp. TaxID=1872627 RepID=UPI002E2EF61C|nr:hypothetical protein [Archangium sp.]HEX5749488.1 hypothetical protein [Archangium sp.]
MFRSVRSTVGLTLLGLGTVAHAQTAAPVRPPKVPPIQGPMSRPTVARAAEKAVAATKETTSGFAYRNATTPPAPGWTGPVFQLSHDYPQKDPGTCPANVCTWLSNKKVTFDQTPGEKTQTQWSPEWAQYMQQLLDYVREGQDLQLDNQVGWQVKVNGNTRWFHMPWMAYDTKTGREFVHGLTNERTAQISDFLGEQLVDEGLNKLSLSATKETAQGYETWAFGVYNEWGGYAIGRSWNTDGTPRIDKNHNGGPQPAGLPFPEGTLVAKLLFTTATPKDVPYLEGSPVWQADRHQTKGTLFLCERQVQEVRLIQLDVAVVDKSSPTRWVFGTFAYNGKLKGKTVWDRLEPVGVQWGNDPWSSPAAAKADSLPIVQSVLNTKIGTYQHFGCNNRLAGPVDNKLSSCMACHANGYTPQAGVASPSGSNTIPPIFGFPGQCTTNSVDNANYFTNNQFPMAYAGGQYPNLMNMDTSLQMWVAFLQYGQFNQFNQPEACVNPSGT